MFERKHTILLDDEEYDITNFADPNHDTVLSI